MFDGHASNSEGPVGAGLDSIIVQDGRIVQFASGLNYSEDWEIEGVRTLGFFGDRYFKSMGYTARATIDSYLLRGQNISGALATPGWQPDGTNNINTAGLFDFAVLDLYTFEVITTLLGVKLASIDTQFPSRGLNTKSTQWRVMRVIPGLQTS